MPPLPKLKLEALRELEKELRFAPRDALLRDMERAEELAGQIDPAQSYPEDWLVFRLTGFRPAMTSPRLLVGAAIATELSAFIERLSDTARLSADELDGNTLDAAALCERWGGMSRQTLSRLRRRGLVARRVFGGKGRVRLVFLQSAVQAFEASHQQEVGRAAAYSRIEPALEKRMVARAERYHRALGCSLNQAAERIAQRYGRSHEAVRQVLRRHDGRAGAKAVFRETAPLNSRTREVVYRAWRRGVEPAVMARKYRRSPPAVRRAIGVARTQRLRELVEAGRLAGPSSPDFLGAAAGKILEAEPARTGLGRPVPLELLEVIRAARAKRPPLGVEERARVVAYHYLRFESARTVAALNLLQPSAEAIDRAETMLRWASRLKVELVKSQLRLALETVEARLGRPAEQWPQGAAPVLLMEAIHRLGDAVDTFDPFRGARLASGAGLVVDRLAAKWAKDLDHVLGAQAKRATAVLHSGVVLADWTGEVSPWQRWLEPDRRVRLAVDRGAAPPEHARLLTIRFGWGGEPPRTLGEVAGLLRLSSVKTLQMERRALREAKGIAPG